MTGQLDCVSALPKPANSNSGSPGVTPDDRRWQILELFAGLGGLSCAWPEASAVAAIDINRNAQACYLRNYNHRFLVREIESISPEELQHLGGNFWWLSPPCQPYSRRGKQKDLADPRSRSLVHLLQAIRTCRPAALGLENVVGFADSQAHQQLQQTLAACGYHVTTLQLCPSQLAWPNRRDRYYLLACLEELPRWQPLPQYKIELADLVDHQSAEEALWLAPQDVAKYHAAFDRIESLDRTSITACFASSYGKTWLHAGSVLGQAGRYRRFSPREVARLLGFPDRFQLPQDRRTAWKLLGNSLSLPAVRYVLSHLPAGPSQKLPWFDSN